MRKIVFLSLLMFLSVATSYAQKQFYSLQDKGILNAEQLEAERVATEDHLTKKYSKKIFTEVNIIHTRTTGDSVINTVEFLSRDRGALRSERKERAFMALKGHEFPDFKLKTISGEDVTLDDLKGKPTWINFWFTTCLPCIAEIPFLHEMKKLHGDKMNYIAITFNSQTKVEKFFTTKDRQFDFTQIVGAKDFLKEIGIDAYPKNVFLDSNGVVKFIEDSVEMEVEDKKLIHDKNGAFKKILQSLN